MTEITFTTSIGSGTIHWAAAEEFNELAGRKFYLNEVEAAQIEKLDTLSTRAKILLSAVAGAVIQHLIDRGITTQVIFTSGSFVIKK